MRVIIGIVLVTIQFMSLKVAAAPGAFTYQGRIVGVDGQPLEYQAVSFEFTITNPTGSCVLYRELLNNVDMRNSKGLFDTPIGSGIKSFPSAPGVGLLNVFSNASTLQCEGGSTFTPAIDDGRKLRVQFFDGSGWRLISPDSVIRSVPFAAQANEANTAQKLGNFSSSDFVLKSSINGGATCGGGSFLTWNSVTGNFGCEPGSGGGGAGTVTSVASGNSYLSITNSTTTAVLTLQVGQIANTVAAGNDPRFTNGRAPVGSAGGDLAGTYPNPSVEKLKGMALDFSIPPTTGQVLQFDGTNWVPGTVSGGGGGSGTVTAVSSANSYLSVINGTTTPQLTLNVGTSAGTLAAGDDARLTNARTPTGAAGGDLSNTYPNPVIAKIQGVNVDFSTAPTSGQVMTFDGTKWVSQNLPASSGGSVTGVTAGTGLTGGTITTTGTIGLGTELAAINAISSMGYLQRTGAGTYGTTAGSALASNNTIAVRDGSGVGNFYGVGLSGASAGNILLQAPSISGTYSLTFPDTQGGVNQVLVNNGTGLLSWGNIPSAPAAACVANNVLTYNGTSFVCVPDQTGSAGTGITTFNGQSTSSQSLAIGTTGTAPTFVSSGGVHTLNIPMASTGSVTAGLISKAQYDVFSAKQNALGFTPLNPANNLSEITNAATARTNLGLGTAATKNTPASGDAAAGEVLLGNDSRLTNARAPSGAAGGDLSGTYPNPNVTKLSGVGLSYSAITSGQFLKYNGTNWINSGLGVSDISGLSSSLATKIDQSQISGTCTAGKTLVFTSVSGTWTCTDIAIAGTQVAYGSQTAKTFFAAPTATAGAPSFRAMVLADLPTGVITGAGTAGYIPYYNTTTGLANSPFFVLTGNLGIGTTTPTEKIDVVGNIKATQLCIGTDCRASWPEPGTGTVTNVATGAGLTGGPISTSGTISLATSGVGAGTYRSVTVDTYGRVTAATNPTTAAGYGLTDVVTNTAGVPSVSAGLLTARPAFGTAGRLYISTDSKEIYRDSGTAWDLISVTDAADLSGTLQPARLPAMTGDVTSPAGSNVTTLANSGATAGTYKSVTVDAKGRVTAGTNPTNLSGYGITDGVQNAGTTPSIQSGLDASKPAASIAGRLYVATDTAKIYRDSGSAWVAVASNTGTGGTVTNVATGAGLTGGPISTSGTISLATSGVGAGTYRSVTVDTYGRVTAATNPTTAAGYGLTDVVTNTSGVPSASAGTLATRPAFGTAGRLYISTDSKEIYRDTGTAWDLISVTDAADLSGTLPAARLPAMTGDVTSPAGSSVTTLANSGVSAGTYKSVTVDAKGRVTSGSNPLWATADIADGAVTDVKIASVAVNKVANATGAYFGYRPNNVACTSGQTLTWDSTNSRWICAASFSGTVTSVGVAVPTFMTSTGGPVTSSGNITLGFGSQTAGLVFAAPVAAAGAPTFRSLNIDDINSSVSGDFFAATGACPSGQTLTYLSASDNITCQAYALTASQVTTAIGTGGITSTHILDGTIATADIANLAVTDAKIANIGIAKIDSATGAYFDYKPNNVACAASQTLSWDNTNARWICGTNYAGTVTSVATGTGLTGGPITTSGTISLATSGVGAGTYKSVTVDTYGRVTAGTNPTTVAGYGITDAVINGGNTVSATMEIGPIGAQALSLQTSNASRMTITSGGMVGIGTTGPTRPFQVVTSTGEFHTRVDSAKISILSAANSAADGLSLLALDTPGRSWQVRNGGTGSSNNFVIFDATAPRTSMILDTQGRMGVNTDTATERLDLGGMTFHHGGSLVLGMNQYYNSSLNRSEYRGYNGTTHAGSLAFDPSISKWSIMSTTTTGAYGTAASTLTDRLTIDMNGNMGIASSSAYGRVHIKSDGSNPNLVLAGSTSGSRYIRIMTNDSEGRWDIGALSGAESGTATGSDFYITNYNNSSGYLGQPLRIVRATGYVGLNGTVAAYPLDVNGDIRTNTCIRTSAGVSAGTCSSDLRLKKDVHNFNLGLAATLQIQPKYFRYNGLGENPESKNEELGVIAQDIEKFAPSLVSEKSVKLHEGDSEKTNIKVVNYSAFMYMIINSIREFYHEWSKESAQVQREIASLKEENAKLKSYLCAKDPEAPICK